MCMYIVDVFVCERVNIFLRYLRSDGSESVYYVVVCLNINI